MQHTPLIDRIAFTLHPFLSAQECSEQIARSEAVGYADAPVTTAHGPVMMPGYRNNTRVMLDDQALADRLWQRFAPAAPPSPLPGWVACGLNERLRYYRYDPGDFFAPHRDGAFVRSPGERSFYTLLIYLNGGFEGGETTLEGDPITPRPGLALCFIHRLLHDSVTLRAGRKYVLRSDVMYRRA